MFQYEEWLRSTQSGTPQFNSAISAINSARNNINWGRDNADMILSAVRGSASAVTLSSFLLTAILFFAFVFQ